MKKGTILLTVLFVLSLTACSFATSSSFERQVKKGNFRNAIEVYQKNLEGNSAKENEAKRILQDFWDSSLAQYAEGKITEQEITNNYTTVENINSELRLIDLDAAQEDYEHIKESKTCYAKGIEFFEKGDYPDAINWFCFVYPEDTENYQNASIKRQEALATYKQQLNDEVKQLVADGELEKAKQRVYSALVAIGPQEEFDQLISDIDLEQRHNESKKYYELGIELLDAGDYQGAIESFNSVYPEDVDIFDKALVERDRAVNECKLHAIDEAKRLAENGENYEAIKCIHQAEDVVGQGALEESLYDIFTEIFEKRINTAFDAKDYSVILNEFSRFSSEYEYEDLLYVNVSPELKNKYELSLKYFMDDLNARAEDAFGENKDYAAAIKVLESAVPGKEDNNEIMDKIQERVKYYQAFMPVRLFDLEPFNWEEGGFTRGSSEMDCLGNTYSDVLTEYNTGHMFQASGSSETYRTDGKYKTLEGIFFTPYEYRNKGEGCYLKVTGDGVELFYIELYCGEDPIPFQVDITNVMRLTIELKGHVISYGMNMALPYLAECYLIRG